MTRFSVDVYQNEFLPADGTEVNAVLTVMSAGEAGQAPPSAAEIIIVDCSGSMGVPGERIRAAKQATVAAVGALRDGVRFAVIAGNHVAREVYPGFGELAIASEETRSAAREQIGRLQPDGGTAMGTWLTLARELFASVPDHICHAILLTDGENQHESREQLDAAIARCEGAFTCDCRGVGTDWHVRELRRIASALLGTVDIVAEPDELAAAFRAMIDGAMGKATASVTLRVWAPQGATVAFLRQVAPTIEELSDRGIDTGPRSVDYPTGAWGEESRDYHVCVHVPARAVGDEMLAARVTLLEGEEVRGQGLIKAVWTDDERLSTRISREVAHYTGQAELADCIQEGLEARGVGDEATATDRLGRAVALAAASGNEGTMRLLEAVVEVDDAATGTVRLRGDVDDADEMALDTRSTRTVRVGGA